MTIEWLISEEWGRVGVHVFRGQVFVHCEVKRWSPALKRAALVHWGQFKAMMRERGFDRVFSAVPAGDTKVRKWQVLFGQRQLLDLGKHVIYSQEL